MPANPQGHLRIEWDRVEYGFCGGGLSEHKFEMKFV